MILNNMIHMIDNFFGNKKQKFIWVGFVLVSLFLYFGMFASNSSSFDCTDRGHCYPILQNIIALAFIFGIIAVVLRSKNTIK